MTENTKKHIPRPVVLVILDGWGIGQPYAGNAIYQARTNNMDNLVKKYPTMTIRAAGEAVGLPWGKFGNSEVGHLNLGLGRVVYQDFSLINKSISSKEFFTNEALVKAVEHAQKNDSALHLVGLVSNGAVHASIDHLYALLKLAALYKIEKVYIHAILDGRDVPFNSGLNFISALEFATQEKGVGQIATISGRFYAMDRNNNWDRTAQAYLAMTKGEGKKSDNPKKALEASYKKKIYDEEFIPTVITKNKQPIATVKHNDSVIFFNYRPDRARQLTRAFVIDEMDKFDRGAKLKNVNFTTFTEYEKGLPVNVAYAPEEPNNALGEVLSKNNLKQLRIDETEKYAHVTYFFNGGRETKSPGEDHVLIPSKPVPSYAQIPEMSAPEITNKLIECVSDDIYDFILVNYANSDMVGHTGDIEAAIKAIETLDSLIIKVVNNVLAKNGVVMITADHGNSEVMFNMQTGQIDKEHTANPVPFILVGNEYVGKSIGWIDNVSDDLSTMQPQGILSDVAPTVLDVLGIKKPKEMTGL